MRTDARCGSSCRKGLVMHSARQCARLSCTPCASALQSVGQCVHESAWLSHEHRRLFDVALREQPQMRW